MSKDHDLRQSVIQELDWEPKIDAAHVGVAVTDGVVTLTGKVKTYMEKLSAERAAFRVSGVRGLANDLDVELFGDGARTDADIAKAAVHALDWNASIPKGKVTVTVTKGHVRLEGVVQYHYQSAAANWAVSNLIGVKSVSNLLTIKPPVTAGDVKERIESAFKRSAEIDAKNVHVELNDGVVTLTGNVRSWAERQAAEAAAWAAPGVSRVRDNLAVV